LYLMALSWQMALTTLAICSIMWYFMQIYGRYQKKTAKAAQDSVASANEVAEETLSQLRVVRTFGTEKEELNRYSKWLNRLVDISFRQSVAHGFWGWSSNTLYNATQVVALMMGGGFVMTGKITPEQLTKFILYSEWVVHSTWWVGNHWSSLMQAIGASEKVFQLLDLPPTKQLSVHGNLNYQIKAVIHCLTVSWKDLWTAPQTCLNGSSR
jgi:ABC-type multidrug transport system fused ATPase/permease subunit